MIFVLKSLGENYGEKNSQERKWNWMRVKKCFASGKPLGVVQKHKSNLNEILHHTYKKKYIFCK
jgi:hypothetical protein